MPLYTFECSVCGEQEILFDRMDPAAAGKTFDHIGSGLGVNETHTVIQVFSKPAGAIFRNNGILSGGTGRKSTYRTPDMDRRESKKPSAPTNPMEL